MNAKTKERVIELLKTYPERKREIEVLRYELAHPAHTSQKEQITAMALARDDGRGRPSSHVSDKTMYIVLNYQEQTDKLNAGILDEIAAQLGSLEEEQDRLNHYVSLLEPKQAQVIRLLYVERLKQKDAEKALDCSAKTVRKLRDDAIEVLVRMYECAFNNR